jgi:nucleotide-binding universal stress UspA family protein
MDVQQARGPVVVGVDGSVSAERAARWAAEEAARRNVPLRVVKAVGRTAVATFGPDAQRELMAAARADVSSAARAARAAAPGVPVEQAVLDGSAVRCMLDESAGGQLVVLGDRGIGGVVGLLAGSVAVALAARGACPVVVVRGNTPSEGPVVVGVDGSAVSEGAVAVAFEAAAERGVPLVAVHAWRDLLASPGPYPVPDRAALEQHGRAELAERLAGWCGKYPDVLVRRVVVPAGPARALVEQSVAAQLVVLGSHGRGGLGALLLGSVSHAVLHRAGCPVMIVRG